MDNIIKIDRILVIRNDSEFEWRNSSYILERGELGIAFWEVNGEVKHIVKSGDGERKWPELPQTEYVLMKDVILNQDFGKHKTSLGRVDAQGKGKTLSEWIFEALIDVKEPNLILPKYEFTEITFITDSGDFEIGSKIVGIKWNGVYTDGKYEFGSKKNNFSQDAGIEPTFVVTYFSKEGEEFAIGDSIIGQYYFSNPIGVVENDQLQEFGSIKMGYLWKELYNPALNNRGEELDFGIGAGSNSAEVPLTVQGYREGLYFTVRSKDGSISNQTKLPYTTGDFKYLISSAAEHVEFMWPATERGIVNIYNVTAGANMNVVFNLDTPEEVEIGGVDNYSPIKYKKISYSPAEPYTHAAELIITLI